ncbi:MAG: glycine cleavage system protein GcvH [Myxococcales bacterium]|nr:glycine cleavage system protein GcvH [Myxococcales bacterium]
MSKYPADLRYTKDHEWARIDGKRAVIGITDFAVHQLGDITMVEPPKEGESHNRGTPIGTVESVKAVSDIYAPLSGKVVKTNDPLRDQPELLNEDCYDEGWIAELELSNLDESKELMTSEEYALYVKDQG